MQAEWCLGMSLVKETRKALLELFPEQAAAEEEQAAAALKEIAEEPEAMEPASAEEDSAEETAEEAVEEEPITSGVIECSYSETGVNLDVLVAPDQVEQAAEILKDAGFFLEAVTGVDWIKEDQLEVIYDYNHSGNELCRVMVRARISRSEPAIATISEIHPGANWHERETHDFFGIKFQGHPCLEPLLLPEDADFHPLLKDFTP